jgi:hypothetical protein
MSDAPTVTLITGPNRGMYPLDLISHITDYNARLIGAALIDE